MENRIGVISAIVIAMASSTASVAADQGTNRNALQGNDLFKYHGCINCHGENGNNPVTKKVPQLGGKEVDHILVEFNKIFSGQKDSEEAELMHSALAYQSSCDSPPTDEEMQKIATWLATQ